MIDREFLWTEIYRPKKVSECILPQSLKETFQSFVDQGNIPNLILNGRAGMGKTTIALAMAEELGATTTVINGSLNGNIDTLRYDISVFASSVSLTGGRKYVILDEADYLNANSTQPALRSFMEEYSKNCGFILTCNYKARIIPELHSRCSVIDYKIDVKDRPTMAAQFFKRVLSILDTEGVTYDKKVVSELILKHFPDFRRTLNELQAYASRGRAIDTGILTVQVDENFKQLIDILKMHKFNDMRRWVGENFDVDSSVMFRKLYDELSLKLVPKSVPQLVLILANYQYKAAFVADSEINIAACLTEIMSDCEFQ